MKPKNLICFLGLLGFLSFTGYSQTLVDAEYFVGSDPGEGNGTALTISDGVFDEAFETISAELNTALLSAGNYVVSVRLKNLNGTWTSPVATIISVNENLVSPESVFGKVSASEYFIGDDPGEGNGENIPVSSGSFDFPSEVSQSSLNTLSLSKGTYRISVRNQNSNGSWSAPLTMLFSVSDQLVSPSVNYLRPITQAEYYFNSDPGFGGGTPLSLTNGKVLDSLETNSIDGLNVYFLRFKDSESNWSSSIGSVVSANPVLAVSNSNHVPGIKKMEYFLSSDPGAGNGTQLGELTFGNENSVNKTAGEIIIPSTDNGRLVLGIRTQLSTDEWSEPFLSGLNVINPMKDILVNWTDTGNRDSVLFHLNRLGYQFDVWDRSNGSISFDDWKTIIWDEPEFLTQSERDSLKDFLSAGNNNSLLIAGEDIGGYHEHGRTFSDSTFFRQFLHSRLVYDNGSSESNAIFGKSIHSGFTDSVKTPDNMDVVRPVYGGETGYNWKSNTVRDSSLTILFDGNYNVAYSTYQWKHVISGLGDQIKRTLDWVTNSGGSLPVEMTELNYVLQDEKIVLKWRTKSEQINLGWEIERRTLRQAQGDNSSSSTGHSESIERFKKIGFISGKGTTTNPQNYSFEVLDVYASTQLRLKQLDTDGRVTYSNIIEVTRDVPLTFALEQNYPNPFNPATAISYQLSALSNVSLVVFDLLGREVMTLVNEEKPAGKYVVNLNASNLSSGVYIYRLTAAASGNKFTDMKKMVFMK